MTAQWFGQCLDDFGQASNTDRYNRHRIHDFIVLGRQLTLAQFQYFRSLKRTNSTKRTSLDFAFVPLTDQGRFSGEGELKMRAERPKEPNIGAEDFLQHPHGPITSAARITAGLSLSAVARSGCWK